MVTCIEDLEQVLLLVKCLLTKRNKKECHIIEGWNAKTSYRFNIIHLPEQGLVRLGLYEGSTLVMIMTLIKLISMYVIILIMIGAGLWKHH